MQRLRGMLYQSSPKFGPLNSSTLRWVDCSSEECLSLSTPGCTINKECTYRVWYGDKSTSYGKLASDTITMNSTSRTTSVFPNMLFGCGVENIGLWPLEGGGLVGLTGNEMSLISQLGITRRFSYCFNAHWSTEGAGTGRLYLGRPAPFIGRRSPLSVLTAQGSPSSLYFVSLEDISVGSERLQVPRGTFDRKSDGSNGIVIDSGSSFSYLNSTALEMLIKKLKEVIKLEEVKNGSTPLCFNGTDEDLVYEVPSITFHFTNLDVILPPFNTFAIFPPDSICLVMDRVDEGEFSVIGSYVQQNMNVGLDLERELFTMAPADCTHLPV